MFDLCTYCHLLSLQPGQPDPFYVSIFKTTRACTPEHARLLTSLGKGTTLYKTEKNRRGDVTDVLFVLEPRAKLP